MGERSSPLDRLTEAVERNAEIGRDLADLHEDLGDGEVAAYYARVAEQRAAGIRALQSRRSGHDEASPALDRSVELIERANELEDSAREQLRRSREVLDQSR